MMEDKGVSFLKVFFGKWNRRICERILANFRAVETGPIGQGAVCSIPIPTVSEQTRSEFLCDFHFSDL